MPLKLAMFSKIGATKAMLYFMSQRQFFPYCLDVSADLAKIHHRRCKHKLVNGCKFSLLIVGFKLSLIRSFHIYCPTWVNSEYEICT